MACRVQNLSDHTVCLQLRGGEALFLRPGEVSELLADELLYDDPNVRRWQRSGVIARHATAAPPRAAAPRRAAARAGLLAELESVRGVGPVMARELAARGIRGLADLAARPPEALAAIEGISPRKARRIVEEAARLAAQGQGEEA